MSLQPLAIVGQAPSVALVDMSLPQLAEMLDGLAKLEEQYENMSGICATLRGLLLLETKRKLGHGKFQPFVKEHFPKSYKTATRYMRIAQSYQDEQKGQSVTFETLTTDLAGSVLALRKFNLDLSNPVVAEVADWVAGRGAYQLMLDFPCSRGGDTSAFRKTHTIEEQQAAFLANCKADLEALIMAADRIIDQKTWQAPSIPRSHLVDAADLFREFARDISAFLA